VALRRVGGDTHLAEDVAQRVFADLALKASSLSHHPALAGWLFTSARFVAAKTVRSERRRRTHEQEALTMQEFEKDATSEVSWDELRPILDDMIGELGETDRVAILLRFFDQRPFAVVGAKLGLSENSARMRVDRAIGKLRTRLARRGVRSTAAALSLALGSQAGAAVPGELAGAITGSALANVAAASSSFISRILIMRKLTLGIVSLFVGTGIAISVAEIRANHVLQREIDGLSKQNEQLAKLRAENSRLLKQADKLTAGADSNADPQDANRASTIGGASMPAKSTRSVVVQGVNRSPLAIDQIRPIYPADLKHAGISGHVIVDFIVDKQGNVVNAVSAGSSQPEFEGPALQAVSQWVFQPGAKNGHEVYTHMQVPIVFGSDDYAGAVPDPNAGEALSAFYVKG
jgi:RNA polymerase sigma factor (sigma-70 family)